jgi:hypothetical protein
LRKRSYSPERSSMRPASYIRPRTVSETDRKGEERTTDPQDALLALQRCSSSPSSLVQRQEKSTPVRLAISQSSRGPVAPILTRLDAVPSLVPPLAVRSEESVGFESERGLLVYVAEEMVCCGGGRSPVGVGGLTLRVAARVVRVVRAERGRAVDEDGGCVRETGSVEWETRHRCGGRKMAEACSLLLFRDSDGAFGRRVAPTSLNSPNFHRFHFTTTRLGSRCGNTPSQIQQSEKPSTPFSPNTSTAARTSPPSPPLKLTRTSQQEHPLHFHHAHYHRRHSHRERGARMALLRRPRVFRRVRRSTLSLLG